MSRHFVQVGWSQLSMRSRHALRLAVQSGARWVVDTLVRVTIDSFDAVGKKISRPLTPLFFSLFFVPLFSSLLLSFLLPALPFLFPAGTALPLNATAFTPFKKVATWTRVW